MICPKSNCKERLVHQCYADDEMTTNALIETFLMQVRGIYDFLLYPRPKNRTRKRKPNDDIAVEQLLRKNARWAEISCKKLKWFENHYREINKRVAHLTDKRWQTPRNAKGWPGNEMADRLVELLKLFVQEIDPGIDAKIVDHLRNLLKDYQL